MEAARAHFYRAAMDRKEDPATRIDRGRRALHLGHVYRWKLLGVHRRSDDDRAQVIRGHHREFRAIPATVAERAQGRERRRRTRI